MRAISNRIRRLSLSVFYVVIIVAVLLNCSGCGKKSKKLTSKTGAKNIILFIGDGMGLAQVKAAQYYANGGTEKFSFEKFPYYTILQTHNAQGGITDSAASGTAMSTGHKVNNGVVALKNPGDGRELETVLEVFSRNNRSTGLVTTTNISHATPASFGAHVSTRTDYNGIISDYLNQTKPDVLFGGSEYFTVLQATSSGYLVTTNSFDLNGLLPSPSIPLAGLFGDSHLPYEYDGVGNLPHLSDSTEVALAALSKDIDGFFLLVEGGRIDHACHSNDLQRMIPEVIEFAKAVQVAVEWAKGRDDTLILVTADHECGGLTVLSSSTAGNYPDVNWSTNGHTSTAIPLYGLGVGADGVPLISDNTTIHELILHAGQVR